MDSNELYSSGYLPAKLERYRGKWVVLCDENVVASGDDIKKIIQEAQNKYPNNDASDTSLLR